MEAATHCYLNNEKIEISALATELGISRASAYRWLGDNDRVLCEVLMVRARLNFEARRSENLHLSGRSRLLGVLNGFMRHVAESEHLKSALLADPQRVLRIVASSAFPMQRMIVGYIQGLLIEEDAAGRIELPVDAHTLAYGICRLMEGFLYADVVAGESIDMDRATTVLELLVPDEVH